jgi:alanyl-tRNA synthetase
LGKITTQRYVFDMNANLVRKTFLDFFKSKGHQIVPSAPLVMKNDSTLLFINAGMNPFKEYFLGNTEAVDKRVADTQKCLRVSGKHNDLEEVGKDTYHHTLFEMLGNWSFGDYFKKEAISWAWELLTEVYKLDKDRIYVTIFEGSDDADQLSKDTEAYELWKEFVAEERILLGNKKDNFWEMGEQGPCGPCSEIHIDLRSDAERQSIPGDQLVNADHPQVVEIWNLVFMQFNRKANGSLEPLPAKHVDTGMGYGKEESTDIAIRVIVDHVRAVAFAIADGQLPSNNGAGYVIRRILRRAIRYGFTFLGQSEPFVYRLVDTLEAQMGEAFPELSAQKTLITSVIKEEEQSFLATLEAGLKRLDSLLVETSNKQLSGEKAFELYDTFGFPIDLTALILSEKGYTYDENGFKDALAAQKQRSKADATSEKSDWIAVNQGSVDGFVGYDHLEVSGVQILKYREIKQKNEQIFQLVLNTTPFYPEGGGQIGDRGVLCSEAGDISIYTTKKENNEILHFTKKLPNALEGIFTAIVDQVARRNTTINHTATHLLHQALREVLGTHVEQRGSSVQPGSLRFDFSHFAKMTTKELAEVERLVNHRIHEGLALIEARSVAMETAIAEGAMALFGEKYGDTVRTIRFGESIELCGGTHVSNTSEIWQFKIVSEGGVAAGIRRIEAITAKGVREYYSEREALIQQLTERFPKAQDLVKAVDDALNELTAIKQERDALVAEKIKHIKAAIGMRITEIDGIQFAAVPVDLDAAAMKQISFDLAAQHKGLCLVLGAQVGEKALLSIYIDKEIAATKGLSASKMIRELGSYIQGGGGGQDFFATAGGKNPAGIPQALEAAKALFN